MLINRDLYLNRLISAKHDNFIKIVTGIRRCGKSFLLFNLFKQHLLDEGVSPDHIIEVNLEKQSAKSLRAPDPLLEHVQKRIRTDGKTNYVLIDEIQLCKKTLNKDIDLSRVHPDDQEDCYTTFYDTLGVVETRAMNKDGVREQRQHEIDFVVNRDSERIYIQSAWEIPDEAKREQELFSLTHVHDGFRKIVVTGDPYEKPWMSKEGITFIGIVPFLLDQKSVETV